MAQTQGSPGPTQLQDLRRQFEQWRASRSRPSPIPDPLWRAAVDVARRHGIDRTARALHLEYNALKRRVRATAAHRGARPRFVELPSLERSSGHDCVLEIQRARGAVVRIQVTGLAMTDLVALTRAVWDGAA
jgi:hypothetical protein